MGASVFFVAVSIVRFKTPVGSLACTLEATASMASTVRRPL